MKTIPLTQGKVALVDDADYDAVSQFKWCLKKDQGRFYAVRAVRKPNGKRTTQKLHQFLMPGVLCIDHRDGDGLNNQRHNLRSATQQQNSQGFQRKKLGTTSKYRGVSWDQGKLRWQANIKLSGRPIFLGRFLNEEDAARAYDAAARKYFGDRAHLNFPSQL